MTGAEARSTVVAVVPAKDEEERIGATVAALQRVAEIGHIIVVDDGSTDQTAAVAEWVSGVDVVRHRRNLGKAAAMATGATRAAQLAPGAPVLFADADLQSSAGNLGVLAAPVLAGEADMTIAVLPPQHGRAGGLGIVVKTAREGISRLTGWTPTQPLSGQRCLTREALDQAQPFAQGWGVEVGLTIDVMRAGGRVMEVPCLLQHRVTGRDLASQVHRARQLADVARALADRSGAQEKVLGTARDLSARTRAGAAPLVAKARERSGPLVEQAKQRGAPAVDRLKRRLGAGWRER
ncbi:MAG: glycosyltransferase family 2 protein [Ornithinimicrobium sp.]|uniref:glycosyltransferase family 2 protein n=1 Tax=Ornithinimicrobium sp. TaxID=1977084 RepID=UPI0026DF214F|nr:glycosyltransferase family 2 protein [Ornithinimicrobium sp.]MDO5739282.1 glycosyltransferase family 2 protein [Ornithinimicrobium sp.]